MIYEKKEILVGTDWRCLPTGPLKTHVSLTLLEVVGHLTSWASKWKRVVTSFHSQLLFLKNGKHAGSSFDDGKQNHGNSGQQPEPRQRFNALYKNIVLNPLKHTSFKRNVKNTQQCRVSPR